MTKTAPVKCPGFRGQSQQSTPDRIRIGISRCLLGETVRYDGGHKHDRFLTDILGRYVEFIGVCPEVECGLSIPREAMRLTGDLERPRLMTQKSGRDLTEQMTSWAEKRLDELESMGLCGFIFKAKSPSSGMRGVKVYRGEGPPSTKGVGIFARMFMERFPLLPVEDEGRLNDLGLRENFFTRVFVMKAWRVVIQSARPVNLVAFHTRHKLLLMAHSPSLARALGKLVSQAGKAKIPALLCDYGQTLMRALALKATPGKVVNALEHAMGYFKKDLTADEKVELLQVIQTYGQGLVPLVVPMTLINHYTRKYDQPFLRGQAFLNPPPIELMLRYHP